MTVLSLKIRPYDQGGKSLPLQDALVRMGAELVLDMADILLIDHDGPGFYKNIIANVEFKKLVLYSHGFDAWPAWDGSWEVHERTAAQIVPSPGIRKAMWDYGYPRPVYDIGWWYCPQRSFQPWDEGGDLKVLYAPTHRLGNGYIRPELAMRNKLVFSHLLAMDDIELTVRTVGSYVYNGLWPAYKVVYNTATQETMIPQIDEADLVIANGTFAGLAIARGKPTLMYDGDLVYSDNNIKAKNWEKYSEETRYPLQFIDGDGAVIYDRHLHSDEAIRDWRDRMIGPPLDRNKLANTLMEILGA